MMAQQGLRQGNSNLQTTLSSTHVESSDPMLALNYLYTFPLAHGRCMGLWNIGQTDNGATVIPDQSGYARTLTASGLISQIQQPESPTAGYTGLHQWSNFNGSSRYAFNATAANWNGVGFISAWFQVNSTAAGTDTIVAHDTVGVPVANRHFSLVYDGTNTRYVLSAFTGAASYGLISTTGQGTAADTWHHIAAWIQYPSGDNLRLLVDGVEYSQNNAVTYNIVSADQLVVGANRNLAPGYSNYFDGKIAHVWLAHNNNMPSVAVIKKFYEKTRPSFGV